MNNTARRLERFLPSPLRHALRQLAERRAWRLPPPLDGLRLSGPGVYGTYIARRHERAVVQALVETVRPGWVCVDVGAHYGYFSLLLASLVGEGGRVVAFEASPENVAILRHNIALNGMSGRVSIQHFAVNDGAEPTAELTLPKAFTLEWTINSLPGVRSITVPTITLDQHFALDARVDLVKMDIEGAEALAVPGMRRLLAESKPVLFLELHGLAGRHAAEQLWQLGYRLQDLERGSDYTSALDISAQPGHIVGFAPQ